MGVTEAAQHCNEAAITPLERRPDRDTGTRPSPGMDRGPARWVADAGGRPILTSGPTNHRAREATP
ncbi:hypothetical protein Rumeso_04796 [Rubellimicrobium mesophilum DSM 19309]|uniref:Uncharacterized protein n=1 Tax=Rubellimicrobium mesophilum DSM 19309 TaxID=442562 RepID=A0A017HF30_9RHOB|nr:hypothetical protein Rumeso_04796 [Rubellimicrobium mesophilum DSM 19309]